MASKAVPIKLNSSQRALLQRQLDSGQYGSGSEVVGDALRLLSEREALFNEWLRQDVLASLADKQPPSAIDDVFMRLRARVNRPAKAAKRGA